MDIRYLSTQLEITFWTLAIPMMSRSKVVGRVIRTIYAIKLHRFAFPAILLAGSILGAALGFLIGLVLGG